MTISNVLAYQDSVGGPAEQRERLIIEHLPQVRWIATRIHERLPSSVHLDDLISTGVIGLIAAVDNFDPSQKVKLATYAEYKIRGAILDSIRGLDGIPGHKRKRVKQMQAALSSAEQRLHRAPSEEEIAEELGIPISEYHEWLLDTRGLKIGSLDAGPEGGKGGLLNYISDNEDNLPARQLERSELESLLSRGINKMPSTERTILNLYYMEERNLREIAQIMGIHLTRVSQLKSQAILRLRTYIQKQWPGTREIY